RDDTWLCLRCGVHLPGLADGPPLPALARTSARDRLCLGPLTVGAFRRRPGLVVALRARRLGASVGGGSLDRWARAARLRRLAEGSVPAPNGFSTVLPARVRIDCDRARRRRLPEHRAPPAVQRPLDYRLRARAARQA